MEAFAPHADNLHEHVGRLVEGPVKRLMPPIEDLEAPLATHHLVDEH